MHSIVSKRDPFAGQRLTNGAPMEAVDMENMRRNLAGLAFSTLVMASMYMLKLAIKELGDEDDEEASKAALQIALNLTIRLHQDIKFYSSVDVFDTVTRNPIPATDVITDYIKLFKATGRLLFEEDYEMEQWLLKLTKAGLPIPQATLVNKVKFMTERDIDDVLK